MVGSSEVGLLKRAIEEHAIAHGDFGLVSEKRTSYYCTLRTITQHPDFAEIIGELMVPSIIQAGAEGVGGMAIGAIPIAAAVGAAAKRGGFIIPSFSVRSDPKDHGHKDESRVSASIAADGDTLLQKERPLAVVEDTMTTGGSALKAAEEVERLGCRVVLVYVVIERHEMGGNTFRTRGTPFKRLFYTDESGRLYLDREVAKRIN